MVFWNAAFCLDDRDHVKFDILYQAASPRCGASSPSSRRSAIVVGLSVSLPATYGYISFYKIKQSATLHLRLDYVFSIYGAFAVAVIVRYLWRIVADPARPIAG